MLPSLDSCSSQNSILPSTRFGSVTGFSAGTGTGGSAASAVFAQTSSVASRAPRAGSRGSTIGPTVEDACTLRILAGAPAADRAPVDYAPDKFRPALRSTPKEPANVPRDRQGFSVASNRPRDPRLDSS